MDILIRYQQYYNKTIKPIDYRNKSIAVPDSIVCPYCNAPHIFIYFNNGNLKSQFRCKICSSTFKKHIIPRKNQLFCPYCNKSLSRWKEMKNLTIYKCSRYDCKCYTDNLKKLNDKELALYHNNPGHFTLHYIYRDFYYELPELVHTKPEKPTVELKKNT